MSEEFINYLKYIGFLNEKTIPFFASLYNSVQEPDAKSSKEKMKMKIINSLVQYTK